MEIRLKIRFSTKNYSWVCFKHAVKLSMQGKDVEVDLDDYDAEYYMGDTVCVLCSKEDEIGRLPSHYSGSKAQAFWDIIHKVRKEKPRSELYGLAVKLQELEHDIIMLLAKEEL